MAIDTWDVYVTDNGDTVVDFLHGVSSIIYSNSIQGLVLAVLLFGMFLVAFRFVITGGWSGALQWFVISTVILFAVTLPKKPVLVQDYSSDALVAGVVEDVPIGLAAVLSFSTSVGHKLTQLFETAFGTVDGDSSYAGFQYSTGGMLQAERTFQNLMTIDAQDPRVISNTNSFLKHCVYPTAVQNTDFKDILSQGDFQAYFRGNEAQAMTYYKPITGVGSYVTCSSIKDAIADDINTEAGKRISAVGVTVHPDLDSTLAASEFEADVGFVSDRFLGLTDTGPELISQVMSINMIKRSMSQEAATMGDGALMDFVNGQARVQSRLTMSSIGGLMQTALPKMHSILIITLIALFPVVITMSLMPGGGGVVKNYFLFYLNLQVWPLMFSIFTRIIEGETQEKALALTKAAAISAGNATPVVDMTILDPLASLPSETSAIAAMMIGLIPGIAIMLTKGYSAVASQVESTLRPISVATENAAAAGATGNISLGNANLKNSNVDGHSRSQVKLSPSRDIGQVHAHTKGGASVTTANDGTIITDGGRRQGSMAMSAQNSNVMEDMFNTRAANANSRRRTATEAHGTSLSKASSNILAAGYAETQGQSMNDTFGYDVSKQSRNAISKTWQELEKYNQENNIMDSEDFRKYMNAQIQGSAGGSKFGFGGKLTAAAGVEKSVSEKAQNMISDFFSRSENREQSQQFSDAVSEINSNKDQLSKGSNSSFSENLNSNLTEAENYRKEVARADNDIASLDNAYNQSRGSRFAMSARLDGAAADIIQKQYGDDPNRVAQIQGARATDTEAMEIQRAALDQAFAQEIERGNYQVNSASQMSLGDVRGISGQDLELRGPADSIRQGHSESADGVRSFAEDNQALSGLQQNQLRTRGEMTSDNQGRMARGGALKQEVVAGHSGKDITNSGEQFSDTWAGHTPGAISDRQQEHIEAVDEWQKSAPKEKKYGYSGTAGGGSQSVYEYEVDAKLTDEVVERLRPEAPTDLRTESRNARSQVGNATESEVGNDNRPPGTESTGSFRIDASNVLGHHRGEDGLSLTKRNMK